MQFTTFENARSAGAKAIRPDGISFVYLLEGREFTPDNYQLSIVEARDYRTPRHRHDFEQIRILLEGEFGFGDGLSQRAGSVGYFCEGTYYTQDARGTSRTLLLQVAGPSGHGYMSEPQLSAGISALKSGGRFEGGVYRRVDAKGQAHNQDAYEAVREHVFAAPVRYPKARYETPVLLHPDRFAYLPLPGCEGASIKHLGTFNERRLSLALLRLTAGAALPLDPAPQTRLYYCVKGAGHASGRLFGPSSAFEVMKGSTGLVEAERSSEFYVFDLPLF